MDKRIFWATKSPLPEYHAVVLDHPAFDAPFRLVANQYEAVTLDGQVHTPVPMSITPPEQKSDAQPKLVLNFPRQVVGRTFKQQLKLISAAETLSPITVTYSVYLGVTISAQVAWNLYVAQEGGINFNGDVVQVAATVDNPMRRQVGVIYDPATFTGLEILR